MLVFGILEVRNKSQVTAISLIFNQKNQCCHNKFCLMNKESGISYVSEASFKNTVIRD